MVTTKADIFECIKSQREKLLSYGVCNIGLFGSFVRGDQSLSSDVDILVEFIPSKHTFDNFMEVVFLLEDLLKRKVEVVTPESLSRHIGPHILKEVERVPFAA
jgi:predicted nucleotidyltransferase